MSEPEMGRRYSHCYIDRGRPTKDSPKARYRLGLLAEAIFPAATIDQQRRGFDFKKRLTDFIQMEVGVQFRTVKGARSLESWLHYFEKISFTELLDTITVVTSPHYPNGISEERRHRFRDGASRIFNEENLAFTIDTHGGIHPLVDIAFTQSLRAAVSSLEGPRYIATLHRLEEVDGHLLQDPPNFVAAIRSIFGACENLFKMMYGVPRLDSRSAATKIAAEQQRLYNGQPTMLASSGKLLSGFREWIDAAHFYRHEEGRMEITQPESEIAFLLISAGVSYLRWLGSMDRKSSMGSRSEVK